MERGGSRIMLRRTASGGPPVQEVCPVTSEKGRVPQAPAIAAGGATTHRVSLVGRGLVLALVLVLTTAGLPAGAQDAGGEAGGPAPSPRGIDGVCPPPEAAAVGDRPEFADLGSVHDEAILCAASYGLVSGYPDGTYRGGRLVTRGQMATFLHGWIEEATNITLDAPEESRFAEAADSVHRDAIEALAVVNIVGGRGDGSFGPGEPLTRGQFARAVVNAVSYADVFEIDGPLPPAGTDEDLIFDDVAGTTFEKSITALATSGITVGRNGSFHPAERVTRGQLATFLMRGADYLHEYQRWQPTAEVHAFVAELSAVRDGGGGTDAGAAPSGQGRFWIDAFDGSLVYQLDLSGIPGPYADGNGAAIHLGRDGQIGQEVIQLADGASLDAKVAEAREELGSLVVGVVPEKDSALRFAELLRRPDQLYVVVTTSAQPDGAAQGRLTPLN